MKQRIQTDTYALLFVIFLTGIFCLFPRLYLAGPGVDNALDSLSLVLIVLGNMIRMSAREHKKNFSKSSHRLVRSGPYAYTRNPMYLGSFMIGAGFVLMVWPFWALPVFAALFYLRFNRQMTKEEATLASMFQEDYTTYCAEVPRIFPQGHALKTMGANDLFNFKEINRREIYTLLGWLAAAVILESTQEFLVFGGTDLTKTFVIFAATLVVFLLGIWISYQTS